MMDLELMAAAVTKIDEHKDALFLARDLGLGGLALAVIVLGLKRLRQAVENDDAAHTSVLHKLRELEQNQHQTMSLYHDMHVAYRVCEAQREELGRTVEEMRVRMEKAGL